MIRTTYPDRICYRPRCNVNECRVLLPEGVRIGEHAACLLGNLNGVALDSDACSVSSGRSPYTLHTQTAPLCDARHSSFHPGKNSIWPTLHLLRISHIQNSIRPTFHLLRISHIQNSIRRCFTFSGYLTSGILSGRRFTSPDISHPEFNPANVSPSPDISHREFCSPSNSEEFSSEDERLGSSSLGVKKAGRHPLVISCELLTGNPRLRIILDGKCLSERHEPLRGPQSRDTRWTHIKWHHCQGPLREHESAETPIGNESNGAVAGMVPLYSDMTFLEYLWSSSQVCCASHIKYEIVEEAMNFMSYVGEISRRWDEPNARDMGIKTSQPNAKGEMYILNDDIDMKAKIAAMARRLEELEIKKMQEKPQPPQYKQHVQASPQASNLEQDMVNLSKVVGDFVGAQKSINAQLSQRIDSVESSLNKKMDGVQSDLSQKIDNLQYSISRFANLNKVQEKRNFPSQPHQIPRVSIKWKLKRKNLHGFWMITIKRMSKEVKEGSWESKGAQKPREVAKIPTKPHDHASEGESPAYPEITHTKPLTPFLTSLNHQSHSYQLRAPVEETILSRRLPEQRSNS
ncbi:hypothetical protein CK203_053419 [Vitis vinifera]|uniref:Uncharacterized protein n=1 Tax=Vitis vinifera TaxID=29760 RepID=A0A438GZJ5_VITVI|nr:hypothetical protein CK203_053419 [Vitis vinifera]